MVHELSMVRIKVSTAGDTLPHWHLVKAHAKHVQDVIDELVAQSDVPGAAVLLDGALLPGSLPVSILRDGDHLVLTMSGASPAEPSLGSVGALKPTRRGKRAGKRHAGRAANPVDAGSGDGAPAQPATGVGLKRKHADLARSAPAVEFSHKKKRLVEVALTDTAAVVTDVGEAIRSTLAPSARWQPVPTAAIPAMLEAAESTESAGLVVRLQRLLLTDKFTPAVSGWSYGLVTRTRVLQASGAGSSAASPEHAVAATGALSWLCLSDVRVRVLDQLLSRLAPRSGAGMDGERVCTPASVPLYTSPAPLLAAGVAAEDLDLGDVIGCEVLSMDTAAAVVIAVGGESHTLSGAATALAGGAAVGAPGARAVASSQSDGGASSAGAGSTAASCGAGGHRGSVTMEPAAAADDSEHHHAVIEHGGAATGSTAGAVALLPAARREPRSAGAAVPACGDPDRREETDRRQRDVEFQTKSASAALREAAPLPLVRAAAGAAARTEVASTGGPEPAATLAVASSLPAGLTDTHSAGDSTHPPVPSARRPSRVSGRSQQAYSLAGLFQSLQTPRS